MRIGIDAHAAERDGSGNCTYIRGLLTALLGLDADNQYILYATEKNHPFYESLPHRPNVRIRCLPPRHPAVRIPLFLGPATFRDAVDILHVQYVAPPLHQGNLVATIHDLGFLHMPRSFSRFFIWRSKILVRRAARGAAKVITGSEFSRRDIVSAYGLEDRTVEVIPNGVGPAFFEQAAPEAARRILSSYGVRKPYVLFVGRLNPRKNLVSLVRAFDRFKIEKKTPTQLVIAGRSDFATAKTLAEIKSIGSRDLVLTGFVRDGDLPALYQNADMFLYPSLFEGSGLPVLEAMAAGTPVITSRTSALPETSCGSALLIEPENEAEIAAAMLKLAEDTGFKADLREKGRQTAKKFTWDAAARKTLRVYEEAAAESR